MKKIVLLIISFILYSGLIKPQHFCPVTSVSNPVVYTNTTITLKILLVEFTDVTHKINPAYTKTHFEDMFLSSGTYVSPNKYNPDGIAVYGSMRDYFSKMSNGNLTIEGSVLNNISNNIPIWIQIQKPKSYYNGLNLYNIEIFTDAINAANSAGLNTYHSDNVKIVIIYAGSTQTVNPQTNNGSLNPRFYPDEDMYIMGERQNYPFPIGSENPNDKFSRIGVHCHEFAHLLGAGHTSGLRADLMEAGPQNGDYAAPAPLNPIWRTLMG